MKTHHILSGITVATILAAVSAYAQNSPPASAQPALNNDVVQLDPFVIKETADRGYAPSETMTGPRVATKIIDLPYQVSVMTSEQFKDFAFFELGDNIQYISSFSNLDQGGGYQLRGFTASYQLRDGFFRLGRYGSSNIDRIEVIKGPNAAIYGQASPGGIINMISKQPKPNPYIQGEIYLGSYNTTRATLEVNEPLSKDGSTRGLLIGGFYERNSEVPFYALRNKEAFLSVVHDFNSNNTLLFQAEYTLRKLHGPNANAAEIQKNGIFTSQNLKDSALISQFGPNSELTRGMASFTATYTGRISSIFSTRVSGNYYRAQRWDFNQNTSGKIAALQPDGTYRIDRNATPTRGMIMEHGDCLQADLLANWKLLDGKLKNKDLLTFDFNDYFRWDPTYTLTKPKNLTDMTNPYNIWNNAPAGGGLAPKSIIMGQPIAQFLTPYNQADYTCTRENHNRNTDWAILFRHQTALLNDNLIIYLGLRYDHMTYGLTDKLNLRLNQANLNNPPKKASSHFTDNAWSPNIGANYKVLPGVALYASRSNGFTPNAQTSSASNLVNAEKSYGYDYGVKLSLFREKLNMTMGGYYIVRNNVSVTTINPDGTMSSITGGNWLVRGLECDLSYNITKDLSLGGGYGHTNSQITNLGMYYMSVGRTPAGVPDNNAGVWVKYNFPGALKGLSVNLGFTYVGRTFRENPNAGDSYDTNPLSSTFKKYTGTNYQWTCYTPGFTTLNGGVRYTFNTRKWVKLTHTISLNVNNIMDKYYLSQGGYATDRLSAYVGYSLKY